MPIPKFYLDIDNTGTLAANRITSERHIVPTTATKAIVPNFGAFYAESVIVQSVNTVTNTKTTLVKGIDYICVEILSRVTASVGKEVCFVILIKTTTTNTIDISYQALGGSNSPSAPILTTAFNSLFSVPGLVDWKDIQSKPKEFVPAEHLQDSADAYGLESITSALDYIRRAISLADNVMHMLIISKLNLFNQRIDNAYTSTLTTGEIDAITVLMDGNTNLLSSVNTKLDDAQIKYDTAKLFYDEVFAKYVTTL